MSIDRLTELAFRDLRAVLTLARHRHFGRAAEECFVSQPTLSAQVRKVEEALGAALFERTRRRFLVTAAGQRLLPMLQRIVDEALALGQAGAGFAAGVLAGELRLGVIPTLGPYYLPHVLGAMSKRFSKVTLHISERITTQLLSDLVEGRLDLAMLSGPVQRNSIRFAPIFDEPFLLMAPAAHPILARRRLTPACLETKETVMLEEGHCLRDQALRVCGRRRAAQPRSVAATLETLRCLVAANLGYTLVPLLAVREDPNLASLVRYRRLDADVPSRRVGIAFRRQSPNAAAIESFVAFLRGHLPRGVTAAG